MQGLQFLDGATQKSAAWLGSPQTPGTFADSLLAAATFLKGQQKIDAVPPLPTLQSAIASDLHAQAYPQ